jgi:tetratricopeptide (TPR) repeat protein
VRVLRPARLVALLAVVPCAAAAGDLESLRAAAARGALDVRPRLELAKALHDAGHRLRAFSVVEHARQEGHEDFDLVFDGVFRDGPASIGEDAEVRLLEAAAARPDDPEPLGRLASLYLWRRDFRRAADVLEKAVALAPDDLSAHANLAQSLLALGEPERGAAVLEGWHAAHPESGPALAHRVQELLGRDRARARSLLDQAIERHPDEGALRALKASLLEADGRPGEAEAELRQAAELDADNPGLQVALGALEAGRHPSAAREHYLTAYFLEPRSGLEVPAARRVQELTYELGTGRFDAEGRGCADAGCFARLLADDNPVVVTLALRQADLEWRPFHAEPVIGLLGHDDPDLRAKAVSVLRRHVDSDFRPRLRELLRDPDLHRRALAAFLAVRVLGQEALPVLAAFLESPAQALRRDALRALAGSGLAQARDLIAQHLEREPHPRLRAEARALLAQVADSSGAGSGR